MKPQICSIHLAFNRGYIEAVLIENTPRTLGVKEAWQIEEPKEAWFINSRDINEPSLFWLLTLVSLFKFHAN
jgi:hypothetical protein